MPATHTADALSALKNVAFNETASAFEFSLSSDGISYAFSSADGTLSKALGREVLSTVLFALAADKSVTIPPDDGQTQMVIAHTTVLGTVAPAVNVSIQTNQFFNGLQLAADTFVLLETSENNVYVAASGSPPRLMYAVKLGGPVS
jgi:hypothetical protein